MINWPKQRAWGWYATLIRTPWFCVKLLRFKAEHKLSMQRHFMRTEIWWIIKGCGNFIIADHPQVLGPWNLHSGRIFRIDKNKWHQFKAFVKPVYAIELQYGNKVTESDIERK